MRQIWLTLLFFGLGCQSYTAKQVTIQVPPDATIERPMTQTQKDLENNALQEAAELVGKHKEAEACAVLDAFVNKYPERCEAHFAYAEVLFNLKQLTPARVQFEQFLDNSQDLKVDDPRLLEVHDRLADIAQGAHDAYAEHLHRGIGLYFLARKHKRGVAVGETFFSAEALLKNAQTELTKAHELNLEEARPSWYLYGVYRAKGEDNLADQFLRLAHQSMRQSRLTDAERRGIDQAGRKLAALEAAGR